MPLTERSSKTAGHVLVVDDDESFARILQARLQEMSFDATYVVGGRLALECFDGLAPDVVLVDLTMPDMDGLEVLRQLRRRDETACLILLSGDVDVRTTVTALRAGAEDVHTKPVNFDLLGAAIERGLARTRLQRAHRIASTQVSDPYGLLDASPAMQRVLRLIQGLSRSMAPALIMGEPGTGKHAIAEVMHQMSPKARGPLCRYRCAGRTTAEIEAALRDGDGHRHHGLLDAAQGGTLLLESLGGLSEASQQLLLTLAPRIPLGERQSMEPEVRLIITTERDLADDVHAGRLGAEFYQWIATVPLHVPSLRSRGDEAITTLANRMLHTTHVQHQRGPVRLTDDALSLVLSMDWPGNVRQLQQVIEEAFFLGLEEDVVDALHVRRALERVGMAGAAGTVTGDLTLAHAERRQIARVLALVGDNRSEAARTLGITRSTLYRKLEEYGLGKGTSS
jgi:DNA-binding NtrC family response regulator